jgi:hypothetical protein
MIKREVEMYATYLAKKKTNGEKNWKFILEYRTMDKVRNPVIPSSLPCSQEPEPGYSLN